MKSFFLSVFVTSIISCTGVMQAQIFPAHNGYFVVFNEQAEKNSHITLACEKQPVQKYEWPNNNGEFIRNFREAEKIFPTSFNLSDESLSKAWSQANQMDQLGNYWQFTPAMLMALGQATFISEQHPIEKCEVNISNTASHDGTRTLSFIDQREISQQDVEIENLTTKGLSIQIKLTFGKNCWVDSARVSKKIVGARDSIEIHPLVMATQFSDRIVMHIRDTSKTVGEYLYSIQPYDQLGLWHAPITGIYAHNYNSITQPEVIDFTSAQMEGTKSIRLAWRASVHERVRGFEIFRSSNNDGPYTKIATLPSSDTMYVDHVEGVMQNFFYYVQILDQTGVGLKSIPHFVSMQFKEKPAPPADPLAESVTNGIRISWSSFDGMHHVRGYYVYRSEGNTATWKQVSPFVPISKGIINYIDSSASLKPDIEYAYVVKSESTSYIQSDASSITYARPGKTRIVQSTQQLGWRYLDDGTLLLFWEDVVARDPFVTHYLIATIEENSVQLIPNAIVDSRHTSWMQTDKLKEGTSYCVMAEDAFGNRSICSVPVQPKLMPRENSAPGILLVKPNAKGYLLQWANPIDGDLDAIKLYATSEKTDPVLLKSFTPGTTSYVLPIAKESQPKSYFLTYVYKDGTESARGEEVIIRF